MIDRNGDGQIWEHKHIRRFMTRLPVLYKTLKDFWMKVVCLQWSLVRENAV
jgi:hypothetical protein